jgi:acyl carrier protein
MERSLEEIGADSIDRSDIYTGMVDKLGLEIPLVKLGEAKTIKSLVDILHEHQNR